MRLIWFSLVLTAAMLAHARAEEPSEARKPRPPPDYSGRVQLHELPARVAPPKLPEVKEDPLRIESRESTSVFSDRPTPAVLPTVPGGHAPEAPAPNLRELINETLRRGENRSGSTGWGWLADDIATNRARRAERNNKLTVRDTQEDETASILDSTNREDRTTFARAAEQERRDPRSASPTTAPDTTAREPALGWISEPTGDEVHLADIAARDPLRPNRAQPTDRFFNRGPAEALAGLSSGAQDSQRVDPERASVPFRPVFEGTRLINNDEYWPSDRQPSGSTRFGVDSIGSAPADSSIWNAPSFAPLAIAPAEISVTPATPVAPSLGSFQAPSPSPSAAINAMGGERERAAPRTLPW